MLKPPRDAHEAFIGLGPNLKDISNFVGDRRLPPKERQLLADMLLGYFLGLACEHRRGRLAPGSRSGIGGATEDLGGIPATHGARSFTTRDGHRVATSHLRGRRGSAAKRNHLSIRTPCPNSI